MKVTKVHIPSIIIYILIVLTLTRPVLHVYNHSIYVLSFKSNYII
jgi:hypothetical protein